jgi:hypothetical protein
MERGGSMKIFDVEIMPGMPKEKRVQIRFRRFSPPYNAGEIAAFSIGEAKARVKSGEATLVSGDMEQLVLKEAEIIEEEKLRKMLLAEQKASKKAKSGEKAEDKK